MNSINKNTFSVAFKSEINFGSQNINYMIVPRSLFKCVNSIGTSTIFNYGNRS